MLNSIDGSRLQQFYFPESVLGKYVLYNVIRPYQIGPFIVIIGKGCYQKSSKGENPFQIFELLKLMILLQNEGDLFLSRKPVYGK